jgi:hypothetical protein
MGSGSGSVSLRESGVVVVGTRRLQSLAKDSVAATGVITTDQHANLRAKPAMMSVLFTLFLPEGLIVP